LTIKHLIQLFDRNKKENKNLEISIGLLVGYFLAGLTNMFFTDKTWGEAFIDEKLFLGVAGVALSIFLIQRRKRKQAK
jgi:hypothetical protein